MSSQTIDMHPLWTDEVMVGLVAAQLLVLAVAAIVGLRQLLEARRLREAQIRPFVVIDFETRDHLIFIVITNIGSTLAREIRFDVKPDFTASIEHQVNDLKMFREGISTLPPGKEIRTLFDSSIQRHPTDLPNVYSVTASYTDDTGRREFEETLDLDLEIYENLLREVRHDVHDVNARLKDILKEMQKWTSGSRGILSMSPEQSRAEGERTMKLLEEHRAAQEAREGES